MSTCALQVRMQHNGGVSKPTQVLSKFGKLVPPPGEGAVTAVKRSIPKIASLYKCAFLEILVMFLLE